MRNFDSWLASRMVREGDKLWDPAVRNRFGFLEGLVSVVVNLLLGGIKLFLGIVLQSAGLISDAVHSLGDMATSLVVIFGFRLSKKPPDAEHPFGHAKGEHVATLIIAVLLVVAGFELGRSTVFDLLRGEPVTQAPPLTWGLFAVLAVLLLVKEGLALFSNALGRIIESKALRADAWHHRSDALTTGIVILGLGGRNLGLQWMDEAAGLVVALFVGATGAKLAYDAISPLLGEVAGAEELDKMKELALGVTGVVNVHDFRVQRYGGFYFTTLHIEVSDRFDVHRMHEISVQLETRILKHFPGECVVHVDPVDYHHPLYHRVADALKEVVIYHPALVEFHDLSLSKENDGETGAVEISVAPEAPDDTYEEISTFVAEQIRGRFPGLEITVRLRVDFSATPLSP